MNQRIVAIIVTHNRKDLLRACLHGVFSQTFPLSDILVVNNASTDGTREMLDTDYAQKVHRIHMTHNVGGAGGFARGMAWATQNGADWVWMMDDDGVPAVDSLARMMTPENTAQFEVMGPLVVSSEDKETLSFGLPVRGRMVTSVREISTANAKYREKGPSFRKILRSYRPRRWSKGLGRKICPESHFLVFLFKKERTWDSAQLFFRSFRFAEFAKRKVCGMTALFVGIRNLWWSLLDSGRGGSPRACSTFLKNHLNPFNGTLISRRVIETLSPIKAEMFIWGDEVEYMRRVVRAGFPCATIVAARHVHPPDKKTRVNLGILGSVVVPPPHAFFISARNQGYLARSSLSWKQLLAKPVVYALYFAVKHDLKTAFTFVRYWLDGLFDRFALSPSRHELREKAAAFVVALKL